jgi:Flp pilus assembly protein TadD
LLRARVITGINARIVNNLSILYARQCRYDDALDVGLETMEEAVLLNNVGYISLLNRDYSAAISFLERAMESSPSYNLTAANNLMRAKKAVGKKSKMVPSAC